MSVPAFLTVTDANGSSTGGGNSFPLDEHIKSCASYVESASALSGKLSAQDMLEAVQSALPEVNENADDTTALSAACKPVPRHFTLELNAPLADHEYVGLTGDSKALGEWQLNSSVTLKPVANGMQWEASVTLQACRNISYRYFVYVLDRHGRKQIRRWETQLQPRVLLSCEGDCRAVDRFGEAQVNRGWLTHDAIVQLKFEREQMFQVLDINKFDPEEVLIKVLPLEADLKTPLEETKEGVHVEVAKLSYGKSHLQPQQTYGMSHRRGEVVLFHMTMPYPLDTNFALLFHSPDHKPLGRTEVRASDLTGSEGILELNIIEPAQNASTIIARLTLPYLVVKPFENATLDFRTTYAHYWPKTWPNLDVGHRGNGRSYIPDAPPQRENTIGSFLSAYERHADMVELDVHLTADGVPVVYHDFGVRTAPNGKSVSHVDQLEYVLIKDVTYETLKDMRVFAVIQNAPVEYPSHNKELRYDFRIFPTLQQVLERLPKSLGIDVEIKWPQLRAGGSPEAPQSIDKNFFIDRVIAVVIGYGCGRPLIFSSFDADICTMLRFKQNIFPVMFLTMGETKKWAPFMDLRTRTFEQAINHAQAIELAGTAPHAEDFLGENGLQLMQKAHNVGQIAIVWGDDCNSRERVEYFNKIGATAICYDRTDLHIKMGKERAFFNSTTLLAEFDRQCEP